jgi:sec-independent protein translocase protein TatC
MRLIPDNFVSSPLLAHIHELKRRLIYSIGFFIGAFAVSYYFSEEIYYFLIAPLTSANEGIQHSMIYTNLTEAFFTYMKLALFVAFFFSFPIIAIQVYLFLAPGLYKKEKKFLIPFLSASPVLFFLGAAFVYYFIIPLAWEFFLSFETSDIQLQAKVSEYLGLVMHLILGFGISFQMPIIMILLAKIGVLKPEVLTKNRKYAFVIIIIIAAILTPPDVISQLGLASVLYALYEISIIGVRTVSKRDA